jgi:hypothetical protein
MKGDPEARLNEEHVSVEEMMERVLPKKGKEEQKGP